ncbi:MAG TPA: aconitase family protein, partial [Desulfurivibrionaceae bacterium]|nr:aconitase family protein [Desulfurivibrionaceae bacterium]
MTAMTLTEKIIARAAGRPQVRPGELVWCRIDSMFTHDPCSPGVIGIFEREWGVDAPVFNAERYALIPDHFVFTTDAQANRNIDQMARFAQAKGTPHYFGPNTDRYKGVCHLAMAEAGLIQPGWLVVGTDSHTVTGGALGAVCLGLGNTDAAFALGSGEVLLKVPESLRVDLSGRLPAGVAAKDVILALLGQLGTDGATYQAIEFGGEGLAAMEIEDRMTLCNMTVEAGAKAGVCASDQKTLDYLAQWGHRVPSGPQPDSKAVYVRRIELDLNRLSPQIALPSAPDRVRSVDQVAGEEIDQVYIGSCTGGKLSDFRAAAQVLAGRKVRV